ncbi:molybdate ABC transporter substrate-binding protein [Nitrospirales bacterium NOB]|nr:Molybdate-binding protein ModA [Nitrospirota bacterium]MCE7964208.1 molybdate ABC transporter substrate-binding protein [Nitrospira sp. NTP2]MCK6492714.1 molybdate ABC transporter substrate-binding protein [Nitrospira sp.]MDL1889447.1 molybdate ABC transporter substrate-binding protein [Nitrospirales bacterium NOB]MEB2337211.1 molybdate ABC transporter substrate-binding protein [Nitrospirales bacterium]
MAERHVFVAAIVVLGFVIGVGTAANPVQAEPLVIGATSSLKPAFQEIIPMFENEYGASVKVQYGPSQTLRRQIEQGAPIDVFLPGALEEVETLYEKGLTLNGAPRVYAQTSLVLVMSTSSRALAVSLRDEFANRTTRLVLGDPQTSSLGAITNRALTMLDPGYRQRFKTMYARQSDEVMSAVQGGKADVGIVYRVDAIGNGQVRIIDETPAGAHISVRFGEAVVWTCRDESRAAAAQFSDFITSPRIQKLLHKYGFEPASIPSAAGSKREEP